MDQFDSVPAATGEWECMECGYVEEGTQTRRPKECPECSAPGTAFEFFANDDEDDEWDLGDELDDELGEEDEDSSDDEDDDDDY
jgi:hypothetical protein